MLELYYNFSEKFCDVNKLEELEMDTYSLYLAHVEKILYDSVQQEKRDIWEADAISNFFPRTCCSLHRKHDKREPGLFKEEFRCTEILCFCSITYCRYDNKTDKFKFSSEGLNKRVLEDSGDGTMSKYSRVLDEAIKLTSTNRVFRTVNHMVATYE